MVLNTPRAASPPRPRSESGFRRSLLADRWSAKYTAALRWAPSRNFFMALSLIFIEPFLFPCYSFLRLYKARAATGRPAGRPAPTYAYWVSAFSDLRMSHESPESEHITLLIGEKDDFYITMTPTGVIAYHDFLDFLDADRNKMGLSSARYLNYWNSN